MNRNQFTATDRQREERLRQDGVIGGRYDDREVAPEFAIICCNRDTGVEVCVGVVRSWEAAVLAVADHAERFPADDVYASQQNNPDAWGVE